MAERVMKLKGVALLYVSLKGWFGERRKATENEQEDRLLKMVPPRYLEPLSRIQSEAYSCVKEYTLSFPLRGVRAVPEALLGRAEADLEALKVRYAQAADDFCFTEYEKAKNEARVNLGADFNEGNYPTAEQLREKYRLVYTVFSVDASDVALQSAQGVADLLEQFQQEASTELVENFRKALTAMVERLEDNEDGKRKRIHNSSVEKFQQFVADFSALAGAIGRDTKQGATLAEVERLAHLAHALVEGVSPENLKKDNNLRATVQTELAKVSQTLTNMVVPAGSRCLLEN